MNPDTAMSRYIAHARKSNSALRQSLQLAFRITENEPKIWQCITRMSMFSIRGSVNDI